MASVGLGGSRIRKYCVAPAIRPTPAGCPPTRPARSPRQEHGRASGRTIDARNASVRILGIDHVQVVGPRGLEPQARSFYGDLLGLEELPRPATLPNANGCWFRAGTQELHVGVEEPFHAARKAHPSFVVEDLDALVAKLEAHGTAATRDHSIPGVTRAFVYDPFGNRLELRQA
jgi:catechol 2,3-dioxygenase-like lactoylglutathione lyase family enzyme